MNEILSGSPIVIFVVFALFSVVSLALWIWSLIHCIQNRFLSDNNRIIGIILIVLLGILGSLGGVVAHI